MLWLFVVQVKYGRKKGFSLLQGQPAVAFLVELVKELIDVLHPLVDFVTLAYLNSVSEVVEDDGEKDTWEEKDADQDENHEEDSVGSVVLLSQEHHVWEVLSCQAYEHGPVGVGEVGEKHNAFHRIAE